MESLSGNPNSLEQSEFFKLWKEQADNQAIFEKCPDCEGIMINVFSAIGGFYGHEHVHCGPLWGYECPICHRRFSLEELASKKAQSKKAQKEKSAWNYWESVRILSLSESFYLSIIVIQFMFLSHSLWIGAFAGLIIILVRPLLTCGFRKFFRQK